MHDLINIIKISPKVCGLKQVLRSIINDTARCVLVSSDSEPFVIETVSAACEGRQVELIHALRSKELAKACGIDVATATIAILKE